MLVLLGLVVGCSSSCSRAGEGSRAHAVSLGGNGPDTAAEGQTESRSMRVGNQVGGLAEMPDYDGEAVEVRAAVVDRLPDPLPDAATACAQMLAAVRTYYLEGEGATSGAVSVLDATRDADLLACREQTTSAAALCVAILTRERWAEYPKLLDHCTRAFPRPG